MKIKENRLVEITYCDYCKQEIKGRYETLVGANETHFHYCNQSDKGYNGSCLIKSRLDKNYKPIYT